MRNKKLLRYGLASVIVAGVGLGGFLVACGDDDSGTTPKTDSGTPDGNSNTDGQSNTDGSTDGGTDAPGPEPAKILVVHAATDYGGGNPEGAVRVCYATATKSAPTDFQFSPLPPLPHSNSAGSAAPFPGIPIGAGGIFPSTGVPLEEIAIRPYVLNAASLARKGVIGNSGVPATMRCNKLLGGSYVPDAGWPDGGDEPFLENQDFWKLGDIPIGTFKNGKTYLLSITGCTADTDSLAFAGKCGEAYQPPGTPGVGNLKIIVLELDAAATVAADEIGAQAVHLSPQYESLKAGGGLPPFRPQFVNTDGGADSGTKFLTPDGGELSYSTQNPTATTTAKIKGVVTSSGWFSSAEGLAPPSVALPLNNSAAVLPALPSIQYISQGQATPDTLPLFVNGKAYTFVLVGDPAGAGLRRIHYLGFPNQFTPPPAN